MNNTLASQVVKLVGGPANVVSVMHCTTRLRFVLHDFSAADLKAVQQLPGVIGATTSNGQFQVVVGNKVDDLFEAVQNELKTTSRKQQNQATSSRTKKKWYQVVLDFMVSVFQPLIPAIAGGGVLRSLLMLLVLCGWLSSKSTLYQVLNFAGTAPIYFLPLLVAVTSARKLKVNELVATSVVGVLVLPPMVKSLAGGLSLFGMKLTNVDYSSQVFPAILTVLFYAFVEKQLMKYSPRAVRVFFVPMVAMALSVPVSLLFLGPVGFVAGQEFTTGILWLFHHVGWVATAVLAGVLPLLVATGMHKPLVPYVITTLGTMKREMLYLPASLAHNTDEAGTCLAIALKTKDKRLRATAISGAVSAMCGITEPAIYGVTLQNKRALASVMGSSLVGGAFIGLIGLNGFAPVGPGLTTLTIFVDKNNSANLVHAVWGLLFSFVLSFFVSLVVWKDTDSTEVAWDQKAKSTKVGVEGLQLTSPVAGQVMPLQDVNDEVFAKGLMGKGFAVDPTDDLVRVPISGTIKMVYPTGHAFGVQTADGSEVLVHVGVDTVKLNGKYFESLLKEGQQVQDGDPAVKVDFTKVKNAGYQTPVMVVVTQTSKENLRMPLATE